MKLNSKKECEKTSKKVYDKPKMKNVKLETCTALLVDSCPTGEVCAED